MLCLIIITCIHGYSQIPWPYRPNNQTHPIWAGYGNYEGYFHEGLDLIKDSGTIVIASERGKIVERNFNGSPNDFLTITRGLTSDAYGLGYVHLNIGNNPRKTGNPRWVVGDTVEVGDTLGTINRNPGRAAHLHFEWDNKEDPGSWSATGAVSADLQSNPIELLNPRNDPYLPTIHRPVRYRRQGGDIFGIAADERIVSGDTVIQGNVDIIARAKDQFKKFKPSAGPDSVNYDISIIKLQFNVKEYKPGTTSEITTQTPILFSGKLTAAQSPNVGRNTFTKMRNATLAHVAYSNQDPCISVRKDGDPTKNLAVNWYYLTNIDTTNDSLEIRDAEYFWDTNGKEGQPWNDKRDNAAIRPGCILIQVNLEAAVFRKSFSFNINRIAFAKSIFECSIAFATENIFIKIVDRDCVV
jgi:hypothetical protein